MTILFIYTNLPSLVVETVKSTKKGTPEGCPSDVPVYPCAGEACLEAQADSQPVVVLEKLGFSIGVINTNRAFAAATHRQIQTKPE